MGEREEPQTPPDREEVARISAPRVDEAEHGAGLVGRRQIATNRRARIGEPGEGEGAGAVRPGH